MALKVRGTLERRRENITVEFKVSSEVVEWLNQGYPHDSSLLDRDESTLYEMPVEVELHWPIGHESKVASAQDKLSGIQEELDKVAVATAEQRGIPPWYEIPWSELDDREIEKTWDVAYEKVKPFKRADEIIGEFDEWLRERYERWPRDYREGSES